MPSIINGISVDKIINEQSTFDLSFTVTDENNTLVTPTSVQYRIDDISSGTAITDWTSAVLDNPVNIPILSNYSIIINDKNKVELKEITVKVEYSGSVVTGSYCFGVRNLKFIK